MQAEWDGAGGLRRASDNRGESPPASPTVCSAALPSAPGSFRERCVTYAPPARPARRSPAGRGPAPREELRLPPGSVPETSPHRPTPAPGSRPAPLLQRPFTDSCSGLPPGSAPAASLHRLLLPAPARLRSCSVPSPTPAPGSRPASLLQRPFTDFALARAPAPAGRGARAALSPLKGRHSPSSGVFPQFNTLVGSRREINVLLSAGTAGAWAAPALFSQSIAAILSLFRLPSGSPHACRFSPQPP
ncbi:uncharacterized protein LOC131571613 [Ammospiza caudacuta]|uniref:uncharacterized protein LOC131571613 n=1 Tax=Ammospiza caudacuta TaxID=2857398 RepID=UPI0027390874|nr:uncharacterized protein LOC131571613 [Ammospiza caudacuta]